MSSVDPLERVVHSSIVSQPARSHTDSKDKIDSDKGRVGEIQFDLALAGVDGEHLKAAFDNVSSVVRSVAGVDLAFSVDEDIRKMVVTVRAVGSDEIIRQFPPEEFLSVAKFIAAQNPDVLDEDFLKGLLFDQQA